MKIVILPNDNPTYFHLLNCIERALLWLGHNILRLRLVLDNGKNVLSAEEIGLMLDFKPDLALFIGVSGIISTGGDLHLLEKLQIPYVALFYDFPYLMPYLNSLTHNYLRKLFTFDRAHIDIFKYFGFENVAYQPLATDINYFEAGTGQISERMDISFVGSLSNETNIRNYYLNLSAGTRERADQLIRDTIASPCTQTFSLSEIKKDGLTAAFTDFYCYVNDRINNYQRKLYISQISRNNVVHVFGNEPWESLSAATAHPSIDYQKNLQNIYASTTINLNFTTAQLATAINQRVFDCFGGGNFLLSDYREDLRDLFAPDNLNLPYYVSKEDLMDKISLYLNNQGEREKIIAPARQIILQKHTWVQRMKEMLCQI